MAVGLTFQKIVQIIISLLLLIVVGGIFVGVFFPSIAREFYNAVNSALKLGTAPDPYTGEKEEVTTATASVQALTWSINKVAWYDTYKDKYKDTSNFNEISKMSKKFQGTTAIPLYNTGEVITDISSSTSKNSALNLLVTKMVECAYIFDDRGKENTGCFDIGLSSLTHEISEDEIQDYGEEYHELCTNNNCVKTSKDLFGVGARAKNWRLEMDSISSSEKNVLICAGNKRKDEIILTNDLLVFNDECKSEGEGPYGMRVNNFQLPQQITAFSGEGPLGRVAKFGEAWINTYGDPEYVLYYEVFPEGEDAYWLPSSYSINFVEIFATEAAFFVMLDMVPVVGKGISAGLKATGSDRIIGRLFKGIGTALKEDVLDKFSIQGIKKIIQNSDDLVTAIGRAIRDAPGAFIDGYKRGGLRGMLSRLWLRNVERPILEETAGEIIERSLKRYDYLPDNIQLHLRDAFSKSIDDISEQSLKMVDETGELSDDFLFTFYRNAQETLETRGVTHVGSIEIAGQLRKDLGNELLELSGGSFKRLLKIAVATNDKVLENFKLWREFRPDKSKIIKGLEGSAEAASYFNRLSPAYIRRFSEYSDEVLEITLQHQGTREFAEELFEETLENRFGRTVVIDGATKTWSELTDDEMRRALDPYLDDAFEEMLEGIDPVQYAAGRLQASLSKYGKKRHVVVALIAYSAHLEQSMGEKFVPLTTNAIGFRTPFMTTLSYDDIYTKYYDYDLDSENRNRYEDFFDKYYGYVSEDEIDDKYLGYRGLLPEVNRYFISLLKDDGSTKRFHLASPCKADVFVKKTTCDCWGDERDDNRGEVGVPLIGALFEHDGIYQTGNSYSIDGDIMRIDNFDGTNPMLYTISENGKITKQCYGKGIGDYITFWKDATYKPSCIEVSLEMDDNLEQNYCYHVLSTGMKVANIGLVYGLPIAGTAVLGPIGGAVGGVIGTLGYSVLQVNSQWPNHE